MTRYRRRERSSEREGSATSCGHRNKRSRSEMACGRHGRCCVPPEEADAGAEAGAGRLQPYVIRGGQRVRCRCGKRDGLQDDIPPPRKKEDVLRAPPNDIQKTLPTCPNPARLPVESPPLLPIEDPHLPAVGGPPLLPDVCPLCRSQTYNLPNLLSLPVVREPGLEVPPGVEPSGDVLGQLPAAGPGLGVFCPWRQAPPQAGAGCLCQCGRSLDDAGREVQGHAKRLQCCGESAAKIAERIEKSLQTATALDAKSNAKEHLRRSLSRGEGAARESTKRSASVPQQMNLTRDGCLKMIQESKQTRATHDTPVYATTIQNIQTPWPVIKQHSTSLPKETHGEGSLNRSTHALQTQNSLERSQGRHRRATPACTGAGDKSTSPGPQYKYNWWCVPQPFARFALQHNAKGDPRRIETEPETPRPVYSVVCPHHPHWHSVCKCVHRIPFVLQTPVTADDSNDMETEDRNTTISPSSNQDVYRESAKPLTETNNCTSVNLQESSRNEEEMSNLSKGRGKLETTKKSSCCQPRDIATQTLVSCVKMPLSSECNGKTIFASRETLYRKVDDSLQPINRPKTDSGTQTILTIARITPNSGLGISRTASKGTVCGSFVRTIGPSNSVKSMSGLQSICPIVRKLIPSRTESVKSTASKGTICSRSERVVLPTRPEGREIAIQAGETILAQPRASKSLEHTNSVHRPITRPRTLSSSSSSSSPCSSVADTIATRQSGTTFPLLSCPEDMLGLPYFSWPRLRATSSRKSLRDVECGSQGDRVLLDLDDHEERFGGGTSVAPSSVECGSRALGIGDEEMKRQEPTSTNVETHNHRPVECDQPPRQHVPGGEGRAVIANNRRENGCAPLVGKALQPKCLNAGKEGQAHSAKAAGPLPRPPAKRPLEIYVPTPQGQCVQRGANQKLKQTQRNQPFVNSKPNS